ncbi:ATP-grasp domain-containing protein [Krasilnikovia sp. M28-CT-15]|uniref:ATP-grasp domain-containing protein n=1 Tax=Krasilnikovia sp. M28-CT-15 TaxID=3373540 RepID=UPI0038768CF3
MTDMDTPRPFTVLISAAGRRVSLMTSMREAMAAAGITGRVIACDRTELAAAMHTADARFIVPSCGDPAFADAVTELCEKERVDLVVPTIDPELPIWARLRGALGAAGTTVAVSSPATIGIASDKGLTNRHCAAAGIPVPRQAGFAAVAASRAGWSLPLIVKPRAGSAGAGVQVVRDWHHFDTIVAGGTRDDLIVEERLPGVEHTVDVYVDRFGKAHCPVVRRRLEVRAGEVSKALVVDDEQLAALAVRVVESLPGAYGVLNVQMFSDGTQAAVIEINARFGGGYPLTWRAGGRYSEWLVREVAGGGQPPADPAVEHGLAMLRWDTEVFVNV